MTPDEHPKPDDPTPAPQEDEPPEAQHEQDAQHDHEVAALLRQREEALAALDAIGVLPEKVADVEEAASLSSLAEQAAEIAAGTAASSDDYLDLTEEAAKVVVDGLWNTKPLTVPLSPSLSAAMASAAGFASEPISTALASAAAFVSKPLVEQMQAATATAIEYNGFSLIADAVKTAQANTIDMSSIIAGMTDYPSFSSVANFAHEQTRQMKETIAALAGGVGTTAFETMREGVASAVRDATSPPMLALSDWAGSEIKSTIAALSAPQPSWSDLVGTDLKTLTAEFFKPQPSLSELLLDAMPKMPDITPMLTTSINAEIAKITGWWTSVDTSTLLDISTAAVFPDTTAVLTKMLRSPCVPRQGKAESSKEQAERELNETLAAIALSTREPKMMLDLSYNLRPHLSPAARANAQRLVRHHGVYALLTVMVFTSQYIAPNEVSALLSRIDTAGSIADIILRLLIKK